MNVVPIIGLSLLAACAAPVQEFPPPSAARPERTNGLDTAQAYATAIADYIRAVRERNGPFPDTVYIGRHQDFPSIALPAAIERTSVRILDPPATGVWMNNVRFVYLNVFAWFKGDEAEFMVIRFGQGMRHRTDGGDDLHLYYGVGDGQKEFTLDSLRP